MPTAAPNTLNDHLHSSLTPAQRSLRSRMAALELHSRVDGKTHTAPARAAFLERLERQVDPDQSLPEGERQRRANLALKAHMSRLALASSKARHDRTNGRAS